MEIDFIDVSIGREVFFRSSLTGCERILMAGSHLSIVFALTHKVGYAFHYGL